ncbi:MAG TPA: M36 family metallopeptidase, partial [Flavobacterium sp.]|nr:M36 family metallopeptidase [Flavobacterium sp.]
NTTTPSLSLFAAAASAYAKTGVSRPITFSIFETINDKSFLLSDGIQENTIVAKLVYQPTANNKLRLAYAFQYYALEGSSYWDIKIDAVDGSVIEKKDLTISCDFGDHKEHKTAKNFSFEFNTLNTRAASMLVVTPGTYRVIPYNYESPNHHSFDLITTAGDAVSSPNGWHNASTTIGGTTSALMFNYTRGNNVLAQEDAIGDNSTTVGLRPDGGASLLFDFPYAGQTAQPTAYTSAATTNLFYMGNMIHDIWYKYGFDSANGNYQNQNYGMGGTQGIGDYVQADSQDGYANAVPTNDNANWSPTNDGQRPRVQMYMWTAGAPPTEFIHVNSPASIAGPRVATSNVFEGTDRIPVPAAPNGITADVVLYTNGPNPPGHNSACQAATNPFDVSGKIALIRRGGCFFNLKVKNAQDAGALAVIVMDSIVANPQRLNMSSTGLLGILIPAVFVTKEIGEELIAEMANGPVNVKLEVPANLYLYADGDFDNGIIGHEYGHGISNRLIGGGLTGCMTNAEQMGEGWSDWFGLMLQIKPGDTGAEKRGVGTYAVNQLITDDGIRSFPYSTDMSINPLTFTDSNVTEVHDLGEAWAEMLWDLTWKYIEKYGFDADIYNGTGGNNKMMRLVADALKLGVCNQTTYQSARDALFAADQATTNGADYCMIAKAFTRRGMGLNASSGLSSDALDQTEDFTPFPDGPNCTLAINYFQNEEMIRVYPNPANGMINLRINKYVGKVNIQFVDINGRVVKNITDDNFNVEKSMDVSSFQTGMYIVKVVGDQVNYTQKVMIN